MHYEIKSENDFQYIEEGNGPVLLLLHGLFGALSNWKDVIEHFSGKYKIVIPYHIYPPVQYPTLP